MNKIFLILNFISLFFSFTVHAATARNLKLIASSSSSYVGQCSTVIEVDATDYNFLPVVLTKAVVVALSGANVQFFSDPTCTAPITSTTIIVGSSNSKFYIKGSVASTVTLAASGGGLSNATLPQTIIPLPPSVHYPDSSSFMTEDQEVAWINSLGFKTTVQALRASYASFVVTPVSPNASVLWNTESDDLRNFYHLYKRTGYAPFLQQAQQFHDYYVNVYSNWQNGGNNVIEPEHIYLMGLIDWYVDNKDQSTLDAINRILDFIEKKVTSSPFYETRVSARAIQCLAHYLETINIRHDDVLTKLNDFVSGVLKAPVYNGFVSMNFYVGTGWSVDGLPAGSDLTKLFPGNVTAGIVTGANTFNIQHHNGATSYQDVILMHALRVAARVLKNQALTDKALAVANAWVPLVGVPFYDTTAKYNLLIPYTIVSDAPQLTMFQYPAGSSVPLYVTQYAAYCPIDSMRKTLQQEALLRQYGQYTKIATSELGGKPKYFPWQTWENGYFLLQN